MKPFFFGSNRAKRIAKLHDARDRKTVIAKFGGGIPKMALHHQELVRARHESIHHLVKQRHEA
jgi:hypothetical protein